MMTGIAYIDGERLRRSLVAASTHVRGRRGELDRINVFPVPDGDTGTNLVLTLDAIAERLIGTKERSVAAVANVAAQGAVLGARGNSGMLLSHFLLGLAQGAEEEVRLDPPAFARALAAAAHAVESALEQPVEGTIVTVIRDTAEEVERDPGKDFVPLLERMVTVARDSLARTPDLLPVLARAGVVDAGAQGFVNLLEGVLRFVRGEVDIEPVVADPSVRSAAAQTAFPESSERFRFCTEALVRGEVLPERDAVRDRLRSFGDSLIVIRSGNLLKVHVHTDDPERVFGALEEYGSIEERKAEDMRAQHDAAARAGTAHVTLARRSVAVVTDSACDLPLEVLHRYGIHVTPLELVENGHTYRDGVDITAEEFHRRLGRSGSLPTTSQPAPAAFLETFRKASEEAETLVGVFVGSTLSGTFASAQAAANRFEDGAIHLVDSLGASLLEGLLVLKAAELVEAGWAAGDIVAEVARVRARSGILFTIRSFDRLVASGRVSLGKAFIGRLLGVKPILGVGPDGRVTIAGKARGTRRARRELLDILEHRVGKDARAVRFGVVHVGAPNIIPDVERRLRRAFGPGVEILSGLVTPVLATHLGIGAWGVAYMVEDQDVPAQE
ncbi:MAG: DegV family protein [Gemmatimonadota bacterium]